MRHRLLKQIFLTGAAFGLLTSTVQAQPETLTLNKNTSHYMDMKQRITRIAIGGNKDFATVIQLPGSTSEFLIVTKKESGTTTLFVWTADGQRHEYIITVSAEDPNQAMLIEQAIGLPDVHVKMVDNRILLTGTVENQYEKNYALQTVRLFVGKASDSSLLVGSGYDMKLETSSATGNDRSEDLEASKSENKGEIIDLLQIRNPTQIRLEAQIIEINSEDAKDLGIRYGNLDSNGDFQDGIFSFGESYTRDSHTTITETTSDDWARNYSGDWTDSYSGDSSNGYSGTRYSYTGDTNYYSNSYNNGWSNDYTNGRNGGNDWSGGRSFNRTVSVSFSDLVGFANNPLKWIGQHFAPINMRLSALTTKGKAKILSRPSVITLSGEQATIQIGGEIPYITTSPLGYSTNTEFKKYGIILQFKPVVDEHNRISSMIHTEVSNMSGQTVNGMPILSTRSADSTINVSSGGTIVIGGLMDSSEIKNVTKVPFLGDIPILGEFFKRTSKSRDKRELIILVTPRIIGAEEAGETYWSPTMREWYGLDQKYREAMERVNFNSPKREEPSPKVDEPFSDK